MTVSLFNEIAGYSKEKKELKDLAGVLKNYEKLKEMGGRMPKGILLIGDNGVGKSIMAKAFIEEAGINCVAVCPTKTEEEFDQHINNVFQEAIKKKPCIVLIEEIDKIAAQRDLFSYGSTNYNRFNSLLNCLNSYGGEDELFVLATANQRMRLDSSLLRSGRIDSTIRIGMPTQKDRVEIFKHYSKDKAIDKSIDFKELAKETPLFSGADIEAVMNDATIAACKSDRKVIKKGDVETAIINKQFGTYEKEVDLNETYLRVVATHEAGHALMMLFGPTRNINRVTILPRGSIRGYASMSYEEERMRSTKEKENLVCVALGGMAAEKVFYGIGFDGSISDIASAQSIVHSLVCHDGIRGYNLLVQTIDETDLASNISQRKLESIERREAELFEEKMHETISTINRHKKLMEIIIQELLTKKVLEKEDLEAIYNNYLNSIDKNEKTSIINGIRQKYDIKWDGRYNVNGGSKME